MNRLVLIGNGFDLAHGMKTRYADFILWCVQQAFKGAEIGTKFQHPLMTVERSTAIILNDNSSQINSLDDFMPYYQETEVTRPITFIYRWMIPNSFIRHLILDCQRCGWVDIENEFYAELIKIQQLKDLKNKEESLEELNRVFGKLQFELEKYLATLSISHVQPAYLNLFQERFVKTDFLADANRADYPRGILLLNFNYTRLTGTIEGVGERAKIQVNYIHGQINNDRNPLIFGFGDELDEAYRKMELEKTRGFFKFIKSFGYFRTSHYHDLIRYIDGEEYQVYVMGHSCGLSDRTMLNMIFEHPNCKSIKLFYHRNNENRDNYRELVEDISRHFHDKQLMRRLIVPFEKSFNMPQSTD
jgi:hypothetical protein